MIDPKIIRNSLEEVINLLSKRNYPFNKKQWQKLESLRGENQRKIEDLQASLNILSKEIGSLKHKKEDTSQIDICHYILWCLSKIGIVWNIREVPDDSIKERLYGV